MKKTKRILALLGAVLLLCMYVSTLVFSLIGSPAATGLFKASVAATILVPVLLYGYILIARLVKDQGYDSEGTADDDSESGSDI